MLPFAIPVALSAIKALIKFRGRMDDILATRVATEELPFELPKPPTEDLPHVENMRAYFRTPSGKLILDLHACAALFAEYDQAPTGPNAGSARSKLCRIYYAAAGIFPKVVGPGGEELPTDAGAGTEQRLAYYLVSSHRLSRNPAVTRILLATADTLLEVAGENAGLFVSNPNLVPVVETLLRKFAGEVDFDDSAAQDIFKKLLSATIVAAVDNADRITKAPALAALVGALADLQEAEQGDFVTTLLTEDGFLKLSGKFLTHAADDPRFLGKQPIAQEAFTAMLKEAGERLPRLRSDPAAMLGVLEAGLVVGSAHLPELLGPQLNNKPILAELLATVSAKVTELGNHNLLFQQMATGEVFSGIFGAVLESVARDPSKLVDTATLRPWVGTLVAATVEIVGRDGLSSALESPETLKALGVRALEILSKHPEFLVKDHPFAAKLLGDVLETSAASLKDGWTVDDLVEIGDHAVRRAAEQAALGKRPEAANAALSSLLTALSRDGIRGMWTPEGRKAALLGCLDAVARNPKTWDGLRGEDLLKPVVEAALDGLRTDPSSLLSGPTLIDTLDRVLVVLARRGQVLVDDKVQPEALQAFLTEALKRAEAEIGYGLDAETLPAFLQGMLELYLKAPFKLDGKPSPKVQKLVTTVLKTLQPA